MRRRAIPLWSPFSHAGLSFWLDASDQGTLDLVSGAVQTWRDKSGRDRHVTAPSTAARPAWSATGLASLAPGVTFDGTDDILTRAEAWAYAAGAATHFLVATGGSILTNRFVVSEGNTANDNSTYAPFKSSTTTASTIHSFVNDDAAAANLNNQPATTAGWAATAKVLVRMDTGANMRERSSGTGGVNGTSYTRGTVTLNTFALGARARTTPTAFAAVTIAELLIFTRLLDQREIERVEGYLRHKWGADALVADHPYFGSAPR